MSFSKRNQVRLQFPFQFCLSESLSALSYFGLMDLSIVVLAKDFVKGKSKENYKRFITKPTLFFFYFYVIFNILFFLIRRESNLY